MDYWSPKKLVLASVGVAVFSSALTGGIVVWLLSGQKQADHVFSPMETPTVGSIAKETPATNQWDTLPKDLLQEIQSAIEKGDLRSSTKPEDIQQALTTIFEEWKGSLSGFKNAPPKDPVQAGNWYYDHQQWAQAIVSYEQALKAGFDNPDVHTDLGNCYRFSKRPDAALEQYQLAQKQNPQHEHSLFNQIGLYAEDLKNPAKASEIAQQFIARFPNRPTAEQVKKHLLPE